MCVCAGGGHAAGAGGASGARAEVCVCVAAAEQGDPARGVARGGQGAAGLEGSDEGRGRTLCAVFGAC